MLRMILRPSLRVLLLASALGCVASAASADPADPTLRALGRAVARSVLDREVVEAIEVDGEVRILAVFASEPGAAASARSDAARARLAEMGGYRPGGRFAHIPALVGEVDARALAALVADPFVLRVSIDRRVTAQLAQSVPLVNLDWMRAGGFTGSGATVAIVDTGVDRTHADLAGSVIDEYCYCDDGLVTPFGCCPDGSDEQGGVGSAQDDHGHGTRVAGIVTSDGVHADLGGAPDAVLVSVKVLDSSGGGYVSDVLLGLGWVRTNHPGIEVLNMSLGSGLYVGDCDEADADTMAYALAVDQLRATGTLVVAGSGNNGSGTQMIAPACVADAISVGAVWDQNLGSQSWFGCNDPTTTPDQVTCWSNSSTTTDILAPGARMTSSKLNGTTVTLAGTSYATPIVSACAAILADEYPSATLADLETALTTSSVSVLDAKSGLSYPRVDCVAAYHALPEPGSLLLFGSGAALVSPLARRRPHHA